MSGCAPAFAKLAFLTQVLIAEAWCPVSMIDDTREALRRAVARSGAQAPSILNVIDTDETPPTYFRVNKVTAAFQVRRRCRNF
eukprot:scaffold21168_cov35-Tisochrysis_lutea.AAC.6